MTWKGHTADYTGHYAQTYCIINISGSTPSFVVPPTYSLNLCGSLGVAYNSLAVIPNGGFLTLGITSNVSGQAENLWALRFDNNGNNEPFANWCTSNSECGPNAPVCVSNKCICQSNANCPSATPICSSTLNFCVQCYTNAECPARSPTCSSTTYTC